MQEATVANMLGIEDAQRAVALDFFIGLHKTAGVREEARTAVRALTNTNTLQTATKRPIVQQELATAKQTLTPMQKKAFIEGLVRNIGHYGQRAAASASKAVASGKAAVKGGAKTVGEAREGFQAGFSTPVGGWKERAADHLRTVWQDHKAGVSGGQTAKKVWDGPSARVVGSKAHYQDLLRTKGKAHADAFRMGGSVANAADPGSNAAIARHFVGPNGQINPLTVALGLHTSGMVRPEATQALAKKLFTPKKKPWSVKDLTDNQKLVGGGAAMGLGYLALRKRPAPQE